MSRAAAFWSPPGIPFAAAAFALILLCSYGGIFQNPYSTHDDCAWLADLHQLEARPLLERLALCFEGQAVTAYYSPVRASIWVLTHAVTGDRFWVAGSLFLQLAVHLASALLVIALLRRLGVGGVASFVAALLYLLHPISDQALTGVNGGINLYPMFFLLLSVLAWDRTEPNVPLRPLALGASALAMFGCMNTSPIFMAIGPVVVMWWAFVRQVQGPSPWLRWVWRLFLRMLPHAVVFGVSLGMRLMWFEKLTYDENVFMKRELGPYLLAFWEHYVLLDPNVAEGSYPLAIPDAFVPKAGQWILAALAVAFGLSAAWAAFRAAEAAGPAPSWRAALPGLLFSAGLFVIVLGTFFYVRGSLVKHRYLHLGLAGLAPLVVLVVMLAARPILGRWHAAARIAAITLLTVVLSAFARENVMTVASASYAQKACQVTARGVAAVLDEEPECARVVVLNLPRAIRRAGLFFNDREGLAFQSWLEFAHRKGLRAGPGMRESVAALEREDDLLKGWSAYASDAALRARTIVLFFDPSAMSIERAATVENHGSADEPGPFAFGPAGPRVFERTGTSTSPESTGLAVRIHKEDPRTVAALWRRLDPVINRPVTVAPSMDDLLAKSDPLRSETLVAMVESPVASVRAAAAPHLARLWKLDEPGRLEKVLVSPNARHALAAVRILGLRDDARAVELLREAAVRDPTGVAAVFELARRKDDVVRKQVDAMADSPFALVAQPAAAALAYWGEGLDRAAALAVDEHVELPIRREALRALLLAGHPQSLRFALDEVRGNPADAPLLAWLAEDAVAMQPGIAAPLLCAIAAWAPASSRVADTCARSWSRLFPKVSFREARDLLVPLAGGDRTAPPSDALAAFAKRSALPSRDCVIAFAQWARQKPKPLDAVKKMLDAVRADLPDAERVEKEACWLAAPVAPNGKVRIEVSRMYRTPGMDVGGIVQPFVVTVRNQTDAVLPGGPGPDAARLELSWRDLTPAVVGAPPADTPRWVEPLPRAILPGERAVIVVGAALPRLFGWYMLECRIVLPGFDLTNEIPWIPFSRSETIWKKPVVAIKIH